MIIKKQTEIEKYMSNNQDKLIKTELLLEEGMLEKTSITLDDIIYSGEFKVKSILMKDKYVDTLFTKIYSKKRPEINGTLLRYTRYRKC